MPVFRNTISLSNATVFIESNSPFLKTALQHMPFGPSHCCALNKGADHKRAVSISEPQKGSETKERETYRESRTTPGESSAPLPPKLTGSRQQRCSSRSPDPLGRGKFLRPKGIILRGNCETVEIMSCEYLSRTINKLRPVEIFGRREEENYAWGL